MTIKTIAFALVGIVFSVAAYAQEARAVRSISVSGEALIMVVPDEAVVTLGVETFNASLQKGQALNAAAGRKTLDSLKALGIEEKLIKTEDLSVRILYEESNHPGRGIEGYTLRRLYVVTLKDVRQASSVINTALASGANILYGIDYRTTALRKHRDAARVAAVRAAREKATALTAELGCTIGKPITVSETGLGYYGGNRLGMTQNVMTSVEGNETASDDGEVVPAGQIGIRARIQATFDILTD